ncbi:V-type ATP synthase subunit E [Eubacteriales bacterium mix99]|jgi:V/A-type H+-transporting ATPase subunit E
MSGLDKILAQILSEARSTADAKIASAQQQAEKILKEKEEEAKRECGRIARQSAVEQADRIARAKSSASLQKRKTILAAKQQMIEDVIQKARKAVLESSEDEYFRRIREMVEQYALPQDGQILFCLKDRDRLPSGLEALLNQAISARGGSLKISQETRPIDGGFVLVYGEVEENCSFEALFESRHDVLQDKVHEFLFA